MEALVANLVLDLPGLRARNLSWTFLNNSDYSDYASSTKLSVNVKLRTSNYKLCPNFELQKRLKPFESNVVLVSKLRIGELFC